MRGTCTGSSPGAIGLSARTARAARFAHKSERRFARILDFYRLRWEYEPHTYPLLWDDSGAPVQSFTPDFYLPDVDVYIELTTLRQPLVTRKNGKLRRFRALYPQKRVRMLYRRDLEELSAKYA
jgi:hypoxanthine phosphoribosyltransferase